MEKYKVYLDNCCYNRPYDDQSQIRINLESQANMRSTSVIMNEAMECLINKLGVVETEIFISNVIKEPFDYTEWQRRHFADISPDEFGKAAAEYCRGNKK